MFIQTEMTPNPQTLKFLPGQAVMTEGTANLTSKEEAVRSPLAAALFRVEGVTGVFLGSDFVTITKAEAMEWNHLKPSLLTVIMEHLVAGKPVMLESAAKAVEDNSGDSDVVKQIKELIETRVRPAVAMDGGDIIFHGFDNGVVKLEMHGSCSGCPSSTITLKNGIENMLKHYVPEVQAVESV